MNIILFTLNLRLRENGNVAILKFFFYEKKIKEDSHSIFPIASLC